MRFIGAARPAWHSGAGFGSSWPDRKKAPAASTGGVEIARRPAPLACSSVELVRHTGMPCDNLLASSYIPTAEEDAAPFRLVRTGASKLVACRFAFGSF